MPLLIALSGWLASAALALASWYTARAPGRGRWLFNLAGVIYALAMLALPLLPQPRFPPLLRIGLGLPLAAAGLALRVYALSYLARQRVPSGLGAPGRLVTTGPYGVVRHPQYAGGIVFVGGWFVLWGGPSSLAALLPILGVIVFQAWVEEALILRREFGEGHREYRRRVGMLLPRRATRQQ